MGGVVNANGADTATWVVDVRREVVDAIASCFVVGSIICRICSKHDYPNASAESVRLHIAVTGPSQKFIYHLQFRQTKHSAPSSSISGPDRWRTSVRHIIIVWIR